MTDKHRVTTCEIKKGLHFWFLKVSNQDGSIVKPIIVPFTTKRSAMLTAEELLGSNIDELADGGLE